MSSIILPSIHFNSVEKGIQEMYLLEDFNPSDKIYKTYSFYRVPLQQAIVTIMNEIKKLSVKSVCFQYPEENKSIEEDIEEQTSILMENKYSHIPLDKYDLYLATTSILYQIELDGIDTPLTKEEKKAYQFMETFRNDLAHYILMRLPEIKNSKCWWIREKEDELPEPISIIEIKEDELKELLSLTETKEEVEEKKEEVFDLFF